MPELVTDPLTMMECCDVITALDADQMRTMLCSLSVRAPEEFLAAVAYAMEWDARWARRKAAMVKA